MADVETENLENLEELLASAGGDGKAPSRKQILDMLDSSELSDELKENMRGMLEGNVPKLFGGYGSGTTVGVVFILLIFAVLLFFGYKLYKSIKEKEVKREEKKKAKQMKKKK